MTIMYGCRLVQAPKKRTACGWCTCGGQSDIGEIWSPSSGSFGIQCATAPEHVLHASVLQLVPSGAPWASKGRVLHSKTLPESRNEGNYHAHHGASARDGTKTTSIARPVSHPRRQPLL